jgi:hypothetical protein
MQIQLAAAYALLGETHMRFRACELGVASSEHVFIQWQVLPHGL